MKRCTRCVLPETFPGITFDNDGVCNFCRSFKGKDDLHDSINKYRAKFEQLLDKHRNKGTHDCLMAYSGGKDSTYTMLVLKEKYDLSILALTMDNGFISPAALDNIRKVSEKLEIDSIIYKPRFDLLKKIFRKATTSSMYSKKTLERASTICTSCIGIIKYMVLRKAIESNIPFITFGWSPGQAPIEASILKNNPAMIKMMQSALYKPMFDVAGPGIDNYFLTEKHLSMKERFPYSIAPLAFLEYDETKMMEKIGKLGWEKPEDTDSNSTNCLLNALGNKVHMERFKFHPYAFELGKLVREGYMDRGEAIERLEEKGNTQIIQEAQKRLDID